MIRFLLWKRACFELYNIALDLYVLRAWGEMSKYYCQGGGFGLDVYIPRAVKPSNHAAIQPHSCSVPLKHWDQGPVQCNACRQTAIQLSFHQDESAW